MKCLYNGYLVKFAVCGVTHREGDDRYDGYDESRGTKHGPDDHHKHRDKDTHEKDPEKGREHGNFKPHDDVPSVKEEPEEEQEQVKVHPGRSV